MGSLRGIRRLVRLVAFGLVVGAIATELSKPQAERTWHGRVLDTVPYDFRPPTWERIRSAYWNPSSDRLFNDRVFGVGWAVNIPVAARKVAALVDQYADASRSLRSSRKRSSSRESE